MTDKQPPSFSGYLVDLIQPKEPRLDWRDMDNTVSDERIRALACQYAGAYLEKGRLKNGYIDSADVDDEFLKFAHALLTVKKENEAVHSDGNAQKFNVTVIDNKHTHGIPLSDWTHKKPEQPAAQAFDFRKELNKNDPDVEVCQAIQQGRERVRRLVPEDLDVNLDMSDSHTALFALAEYWQGKYKKLKEQPAAQADLLDMLVAISSAVADSDERAAQSMLREAINMVNETKPAHAAQPAQQPAAQGEPVAAQCRFPGVAWGQCDVEHARMVLNAPNEWPKYEVRLLYAHPSPAAQVPEGWKLVPKKCTEVMKDVGIPFEYSTIHDGRLLAQSMWNELLSASPKPPEPPTHSREWFQNKVQQTQERVNAEWSDSMKANAVHASATLPAAQPPAQAVEQAVFMLGVAAEREACALLCEAMREKSRNSLFRSALTTAAGAIRARSSQAEKGGAL